MFPPTSGIIHEAIASAFRSGFDGLNLERDHWNGAGWRPRWVQPRYFRSSPQNLLQSLLSPDLGHAIGVSRRGDSPSFTRRTPEILAKK